MLTQSQKQATMGMRRRHMSSTFAHRHSTEKQNERAREKKVLLEKCEKTWGPVVYYVLEVGG